MSWLPYPYRNSPQHPLTRLHGPQSQSASLGEQKDLLFLTGFKPQTIQPQTSHYTDYAILTPPSFIVHAHISHSAFVPEHS